MNVRACGAQNQMREMQRWIQQLEVHLDQPLTEHLQDVCSDVAICSLIEKAVAEVDFFKKKIWQSSVELGFWRLALYALVRSIKPGSVVETGVLHGLTSLVILQALNRNDAGTLFSVDLPSYYDEGPANQDGHVDTLPPGKEAGWVVAARQRNRWNLRLGASTAVLPAIFDEIETLDIFIHDSEHTYDTMSAEFELAWPVLRPGGLLIADNITDNSAFLDFALARRRTPIVLPQINLLGGEANAVESIPRFGILKK